MGNGNDNKQLERIEQSPRWVRGKINDTYAVDCKQPLLVWGHEKYPTYFFPVADVQMDLLSKSEETDTLQFWDLAVNDRKLERAAYQYKNQPKLDGYIAFKWKKVDHWFEEEEEVFVHARDPYKRVDVLKSSRYVKVEKDGTTLAETDRPFLLFETNLPTRFYIHPDDVNNDMLTSSDTKTQCPYKGTASYYNVKAGDNVYEDLAWYYPSPVPEQPKLKDLICFFNEKVDLTVDGEKQERPETYWS